MCVCVCVCVRVCVYVCVCACVFRDILLRACLICSVCLSVGLSFSLPLPLSLSLSLSLSFSISLCPSLSIYLSLCPSLYASSPHTTAHLSHLTNSPTPTPQPPLFFSLFFPRRNSNPLELDAHDPLNAGPLHVEHSARQRHAQRVDHLQHHLERLRQARPAFRLGDRKTGMVTRGTSPQPLWLLLWS